MRTINWNSLNMLTWLALASASALPSRPPARKGGITLPFIKHSHKISGRDGDEVVGGTVGLGDQQDLFYTVAVTVGKSTTTVNLDTGSADLWVIDSSCKTSACVQSNAPRYNTDSFHQSGGTVDLTFGDSVTGTHASGPVGRDTVTIAGLVMENQTLAAVSDTDNSAVSTGGAGILGLGFFSQSFVQASAVNAEIANVVGTDTFVEQTPNSGPVVSRLILSDAIDEPLFSITLQRDTIDVSGEGQITIGQLPEGVDNSSLTWVPVRLYDESVGGLTPPSFASQEVYPLRWEVVLDGVFLDGQELPGSTQTANGIPNPSLSALIDTGNSIIRGPTDVINNILSKVSPAFAADATARPTLPCTDAHSLAFKIGGQLFPVDPRDFVSQGPSDGSSNPQCSADNIVGTDAPQSGALFSWNLGDPFLKSNLVVFYYGNITHPSLDPPRMGFKSLVPTNADDLLDGAVTDAQKDGGNFESTSDAAPTASSLIREGDISSGLATTGAATATKTGGAAGGATGTVSGQATATLPGVPTATQPNAASALYRQRAQNGVWTMLLLPALSLLLSLRML
ncbi:aspartic peptidase domain-containing protein [Trametes gibbosa]|nr:aspartic peptidase domain-containing protein [Trametes gibbosa]